MMPTSHNLDPMGGSANSGSSLLGFLKAPGTMLQGYNQVPDDIATGLSDSAARMFSTENLRSLSAMLGSGEGKPFGLLLNPSGLLDRLRFNFSFFYLNYMILTAVLFVLNLFISPRAWLGILILSALWTAMINSIQDERILKMATGGMTIFSGLFLWYLLGGTFQWTLYLSGFLILGHALFRDTSSMQMQQNYTDPMIIPGDSGFYRGPQLVGA